MARNFEPNFGKDRYKKSTGIPRLTRFGTSALPITTKARRFLVRSKMFRMVAHRPQTFPYIFPLFSRLSFSFLSSFVFRLSSFVFRLSSSVFRLSSSFFLLSFYSFLLPCIVPLLLPLPFLPRSFLLFSSCFGLRRLPSFCFVLSLSFIRLRFSFFFSTIFLV